MAEFDRRKISYRFIFTGQHQETMDALRQNFNLREPDVILYSGRDITKIGQMILWAFRILWKILWQREKIFGAGTRDDVVLTHGDTFSTLLGALAGRLAGKRVAHVESGLRSFRWFHPFPEEITRLLTFRLSNIYFCPGAWATKNLKKYRGEKVNTQHNTLLDGVRIAVKDSAPIPVKTPNTKFVLCSVHRFENIFRKNVLEKIVEQILKISKKFPIMFVLHPPTEQQLKKFGLWEKLKTCERIHLFPRQSFFDFIKILNASEFLITDGGSNQEESFFLGKPCLLFRHATERQEGIGKSAFLSELDPKKIDEFVQNYEKFQGEFSAEKVSPTGIIADFLTKK